MSYETVEVFSETNVETGFMYCPNCGFEIPDSIIVCWKCGKRFKLRY
jgi:hypothetical protein